MSTVQWIPVLGKPDYVSTCGNFVAVYRGTTGRGFASYAVFAASIPAKGRKLSAALSVGGLPSQVQS